MRLIRILQISDILAGSPQFPDSPRVTAGDIFDELTSWVDENSPGDRLDVVDYIVVCGNVTAEGKPEHFAEAGELLRELGNKLLVKDALPHERWKKETRFNRMMVVPGRTDVPIVYEQDGDRVDGEDEGVGTRLPRPYFRPFKEFHDKLFSDELKSGRVAAFEPGRAICRPLKDLTLVGASYWDIDKAGVRQRLLEIFGAEVEGAKRQLSEFEYLKYSPRLLISAAYPLYNWDVRELYRDIRRFLRDELRFSLHLFGSGSIVGVLPEPYSLPHIGLGTGPRSPEGFWPFRANLIEMCVGSGQALSPDRPLISNYVFHRVPEGTKFERRDHFRGQLDLYFKRRQEAPPQESVYALFVKQIETAIYAEEKKLILVSGLPGSGKWELFKLLEEQTELGSHKVQVVSIALDTYDRKTLNESLAAAEMKIDAEQQPAGASQEVIRLGKKRDVILLVRDLYYHRLGNRKSEVAEFLNEETINKLFMFGEGGAKVKAIVYSVSGSEPDVQLEPALPDHRTASIVLAPLATDAIKLLVKQYSLDAPVIELDLDSVTGGFGGFSRLLLDATKEAFDYVGGAEPISSATSARLMHQVLESSPKLRDEAELYLKAIESLHAGAAVSQFIQDEIRRLDQPPGRRVRGAGQRPNPLDVSISVRKLKKTIKSVTERGGVERTLEQFESMGILSRDRSNPDLYKVRVVAPFLIGSRQPSRAPRGDADAGAAPGGTPFVNPLTTRIDFLIVTALSQEREAVLKLLTGARKLDPSDDMYTYHSAQVPVKTAQGTAGSYNVIVMSYPGMGRVQAGIATANAIHRWRPNCVLLVGIAGGVEQRGVHLGDILVAEQVIDYDLQKLKEGEEEIRWKAFQTDGQLRLFAENLTAADYQPFLPENRPGEGTPQVFFGNIASGDKVDARGEIIAMVGKTWPNLIGIEMEAAGTALAALQDAHRPRFFMVRGVSDLADKDKDTARVGDWRQYACDVAAAYAVALLKSGPVKLSSGAGADAVQPPVREQAQAQMPPAAQAAPPVQAPPAAGRPAARERAPAARQDALSTGDVRVLADLLDRSGKAELDSRGTLCFNINLDPNDLYFLRTQKNIDFATQLVAGLNRTANRESLLALCDILTSSLHGDYATQLEEIRGKLEP